MTIYQFCIIILAGFPALICLAYLLYPLIIWFEDISEKKWLKQIENSSYCYMCGDYVDSKKCDEADETLLQLLQLSLCTN